MALRSSRSCDKLFISNLKRFLGGSTGGFSWNLNLSAVWDEDLGYLCFKHVRLDFSTHGEVPLVRGKLLPNTFYKEICQIFIPDTFFIFFKFSLFQTKCYSSLCFCNILHGFDTFPYTFLTENMEGKKDKQAWGH